MKIAARWIALALMPIAGALIIYASGISQPIPAPRAAAPKVGLVTPGPDFELTVGDNNVPFAIPVYDQVGNPITLPAGTVVEFRYRIQTDLDAGVESAGKVTGPAPGLATYVFKSADTTTPGFYNGQFVITLPIADGGVDGSQQTLTYPQNRMLKIQVRAQP